MDPQLAKYLMIGAVFFGAFVVVPVVMAMLSHQQKMTQLLNKTNSDAEDLRALLERVERKLDALSPRAVGAPPASTLPTGAQMVDSPGVDRL